MGMLTSRTPVKTSLALYICRAHPHGIGREMEGALLLGTLITEVEEGRFCCTGAVAVGMRVLDA